MRQHSHALDLLYGIPTFVVSMQLKINLKWFWNIQQQSLKTGYWRPYNTQMHRYAYRVNPAPTITRNLLIQSSTRDTARNNKNFAQFAADNWCQSHYLKNQFNKNMHCTQQMLQLYQFLNVVLPQSAAGFNQFDSSYYHRRYTFPFPHQRCAV